MRGSSAFPVGLALTMTLAAATELFAHRSEDYLQAARIGLGPDTVQIDLSLTPGVAMAESFVAAVDRDQDGSLSVAEQRGYAGQIVSALQVEIDARPLRPRLLGAHFPEPAAIRRGEGTLRLALDAELPRLPKGAHRLRFRNSHLADHSAYLANALAPASPRVAVTGQRRTSDQRELTIEYALD